MIKELYKQCYSSSFYLIMTISTFNTLIIIFRIMAIINSNSNPFKNTFLKYTSLN